MLSHSSEWSIAQTPYERNLFVMMYHTVQNNLQSSLLFYFFRPNCFQIVVQHFSEEQYIFYFAGEATEQAQVMREGSIALTNNCLIKQGRSTCTSILSRCWVQKTITVCSFLKMICNARTLLLLIIIRKYVYNSLYGCFWVLTETEPMTTVFFANVLTVFCFCRIGWNAFRLSAVT